MIFLGFMLLLHQNCHEQMNSSQSISTYVHRVSLVLKVLILLYLSIF